MIHILTLSYNGQDKLKKLQHGLIKNLEKLGEPWIWYIRDNGSKDNTVEEISKWDNVKILAKDHNRDNFSQGMNSLSCMAHPKKIIIKGRSIGKTTDLYLSNYIDLSNDIYLLLNNDVEFFDDDSLNKMFKLMTPDVGIVGARLLYPGTNKLQHAGTIFSERYGRMPYHYRHQEESDINAEKNRYFQAVTAAVCMIRVGDFDDVGGFDEKFFWAFDDVDLNLKIGALGKKIVYCGGTKIYHEESASLKKNPVNKMFLSQNVAYFKSKWFDKYIIDHENYLNAPCYNEIKT